jgi:hypothetical protein
LGQPSAPGDLSFLTLIRSYKSTMLTNFARHGILCFLSITLIQITNAIFILQPVVSLQAFFNP